VATGLSTGALLIALVGFLPLPVPALFVMLGVASLFISGTLPSRDLLVRGAAPPGATGRVFGLVYSGLDVGSAIGPLIAGYLLDHNRPDLLMYFVAAVLLVGVGSAVSVRQLGRASPA
jgi:MFS family permease